MVLYAQPRTRLSQKVQKRNEQRGQGLHKGGGRYFATAILCSIFSAVRDLSQTS